MYCIYSHAIKLYNRGVLDPSNIIHKSLLHIDFNVLPVQPWQCWIVRFLTCCFDTDRPSWVALEESSYKAEQTNRQKHSKCQKWHNEDNERTSLTAELLNADWPWERQGCSVVIPSTDLCGKGNETQYVYWYNYTACSIKLNHEWLLKLNSLKCSLLHCQLNDH